MAMGAVFFEQERLSRQSAISSVIAPCLRADGEKIPAVFITALNLPGHSTQVLVAFGDALDRILGLVVLDDVVLDSGLLRLRENPLPIDNPMAHGSHIFERVAKTLTSGLRHRRYLLDVFDVDE